MTKSKLLIGFPESHGIHFHIQKQKHQDMLNQVGVEYSYQFIHTTNFGQIKKGYINWWIYNYTEEQLSYLILLDAIIIE